MAEKILPPRPANPRRVEGQWNKTTSPLWVVVERGNEIVSGKQFEFAIAYTMGDSYSQVPRWVKFVRRVSGTSNNPGGPNAPLTGTQPTITGTPTVVPGFGPGGGAGTVYTPTTGPTAGTVNPPTIGGFTTQDLTNLIGQVFTGVSSVVNPGAGNAGTNVNDQAPPPNAPNAGAPDNSTRNTIIGVVVVVGVIGAAIYFARRK
jgi:hypothetical protein